MLDDGTKSVELFILEQDVQSQSEVKEELDDAFFVKEMKQRSFHLRVVQQLLQVRMKLVLRTTLR